MAKNPDVKLEIRKLKKEGYNYSQIVTKLDHTDRQTSWSTVKKICEEFPNLEAGEVSELPDKVQKSSSRVTGESVSRQIPYNAKGDVLRLEKEREHADQLLMGLDSLGLIPVFSIGLQELFNWHFAPDKAPIDMREVEVSRDYNGNIQVTLNLAYKKLWHWLKGHFPESPLWDAIDNYRQTFKKDVESRIKMLESFLGEAQKYGIPNLAGILDKNDTESEILNIFYRDLYNNVLFTAIHNDWPKHNEHDFQLWEDEYGPPGTYKLRIPRHVFANVNRYDWWEQSVSFYINTQNNFIKEEDVQVLKGTYESVVAAIDNVRRISENLVSQVYAMNQSKEWIVGCDGCPPE